MLKDLVIGHAINLVSPLFTNFNLCVPPCACCCHYLIGRWQVRERERAPRYLSDDRIEIMFV